MQMIFNDNNLVDTCWPFQQDCPPSPLEFTTWHYSSTAFTILPSA